MSDAVSPGSGSGEPSGAVAGRTSRQAHAAGSGELAPDGPGRPPLPALARARRISRVLDELVRIPGTKRRVGLDPLFGLVPGLGDWVPLLVSLDLIVAAARFGAGPALLLRMLGHLVVDAILGMIPLLGDLFDVGWKANRRNLVLLERLIADRERTRRESRWIVGSVAVGAFGAVMAGIWLSWWLVTSILGALTG